MIHLPFGGVAPPYAQKPLRANAAKDRDLFGRSSEGFRVNMFGLPQTNTYPVMYPFFGPPPRSNRVPKQGATAQHRHHIGDGCTCCVYCSVLNPGCVARETSFLLIAEGHTRTRWGEVCTAAAERGTERRADRTATQRWRAGLYGHPAGAIRASSQQPRKVLVGEKEFASLGFAA